MDKTLPPPSSCAPRSAGFSLVEVAMSIGIIAFAFVALFALVPTGLTTFREAIDMSNETWIMQNMNSMVQTTEFRRIEDLGYDKSKEIYYFDEEGKLIETENNASNDPAAKRNRLYAVKLLVERLFRPNAEDAESADSRMPHGWRIVAVIAPFQNPRAMEEFKPINDASSLENLPPATTIHSRSFVVARMDSEREISK